MGIRIFRNKKKLPEGTKEQGGLETFKFRSAWNDLEKGFYIRLTSRKTLHTARLQKLTVEEYKEIIESMVRAYEDKIRNDING